MTVQKDPKNILKDGKFPSNPAVPIESIADFLEKQAKQNPDKIAVIFNSEYLTYSSLNLKINQLAYSISQHLSETKTVVCIALDRSIDLVICILATLKAGGTYVPLDLHHPKQRHKYIINDCRPTLLITSKNLKEHFNEFECKQFYYSLSEEVPCDLKKSARLPHIFPDQLAYILYTSGSTGQPKGVMISHKSLINFLKSFTDLVSLKKTDRFLSVTTPSFDISMLEYLGPLITGGTLILASHDITNQGSCLLVLLEKQKTNIMQATPITWQILLEAGWYPIPDFRVLCGGEPLPAKLFKKLLTYSIRLWNLYGPTETTIWSTFAEYTSKDSNKEIAIGFPIPNTQVILVAHEDSRKTELCISGSGVALGYWNRPDLTAEKFIPNSYSSSSLHQRMYCTGDTATKLEDGSLKYIGRLDNQVKIRGYRVELEEIESYLNNHNDITCAIVQAELTHQNYHKLVAYVIPKNKQFQKKIFIKEIKNFLVKNLPEYMVPQQYKFIEQFPLTFNGKVDRKRIVEALEIQEVDTKPLEIPSSFLEELLTKIYQEELQIEDLGVEDDLFGFGLDSLSCLKITIKLKFHQFDVNERTLFSCNTIKKLAKYIEEKTYKTSTTPLSILKHSEKAALASFSQQRLWLMDHLLPSKGLYNLAYAFRIKGYFSYLKFENTIKCLISRHETFRTIFLEKEGEVFQQVLPEENFPLNIEKYSIKDTLDVDVEQLLAEQAKRPFILSSAPLFRICLINLNSKDHIVSFVIHHILIDEWSLGIFFDEFKKIYLDENNFSNLPPLNIQNIDFSIAQRKYVESKQLLAQSEFWQKQLEDIIQEPLIHTNRKRTENGGYHTAQFTHLIPTSLFSSLQKIADQAKVTLFMTLASVLSVFLYRYSNSPNNVIGTPIANRHYPEVKNLIGFLVNMVALKSTFTDQMSFAEVLSQMRTTVLDAYENQDLPFEHVVNSLNIKHNLGIHPIFQIVLILQNSDQKLSLTGLDIEEIEVEKKFNNPSAFDLTLWAREKKEGLELRFEYAEELYEKETIQWFGKYLENIIEAVVANPREKINNISLFSLSQLTESIHKGSENSFIPDDGVIERLKKYAESHSSKICVIFKDHYITYGVILQQVNFLAEHLSSYAIELEDPICVLGERNIEFLISILAILKIGATYVPIDPKLPKERIQNILISCRPCLILTNSELKNLCEELVSNGIPIRTIDKLLQTPLRQKFTHKNHLYPSNRLSYIIFTSGSTGNPKGAMVEHYGMLNHLYAKINDLQLTSNDIIAQTATQAFDISIWQFLVGIFIGASTWICPTEEFWDSHQFLLSLKKHCITIAQTVPSHIVMLLDTVQNSSKLIYGLSLRYLISTGEPLHASLVIRWFKSFVNISIVNAYGPTECSDDVTHYQLMKEEKKLNDVIPISGVVNNVMLYFLDPFYSFTPYGASAELCIGGPAVGRGYLNDPEKTAITFLPDPFFSLHGSRMYLTGDLVRVNFAGDILFLGRIDSQVKIRGYRIELEDIEEHLESHPRVKRAKAVLLNSSENKNKIIAYLVCDFCLTLKQDQQAFAFEIREFLSNKLPSYMIPSYFIFIDNFPLNINGKIDHKKLPVPNSRVDKEDDTPPRNHTEHLLLSLIRKLLKVNKVGIFDNFFDLGANSLLAITLSSEIKKHFNRSISIIDVFKYPTIVELAKSIHIQNVENNSIHKIHSGSSSSPILFLMHASDGLTFAYSHLASCDFEFSIYSLKNPRFGQGGSQFFTLEEMAHYYMNQIRKVQPHGPYYLGGWSFGGCLAFEIAAQLENLNETIEHVFLIDSFVDSAVSDSIDQSTIDEILENYGIKIGSTENKLFSDEMINNHFLLTKYQPKFREFNVTLLKAVYSTSHFPSIDPYNGWRHLVKNLNWVELPACHYDVFSVKKSLEIIVKNLTQIIKTNA
ncbi:non-ribosomal peptide synthetase [Candidatus Protochlamydia sp. W-9]|uniref:non-ribosomal peptide synthetase n=1 Tax=Candidatus Protochlamydia sp. W-9 TaxID=1785087 RepID=UPI00096AC600|nr:non-ribosomal peptide synthetase [Candidatus Protochlamydia sp. W-9]